ncbi:uncharacterized protein EDB91DRAFT_1246458 [Suillus paluster]|uniref:uncharacterized protein n=1 Tax=Suillus paluster TaxID=48578 RepID=UPI001B87C4B5|nr:uncharacterized protein EDB91DRAFT_1246458 [Suillus paluster]KAG1744930.1 hypothetical protein EDB91DRAFT_1246458 [Suillus paluster]
MATRLLTNIITVYPDIQFQGVDQGPSQSMLLTICFSGRLPTQVIERNIPVQISVSFAEEYRSFTSPVVEATSMDLCSSAGESIPLDATSLCSQGHGKLPACQDDIDIPFLPLQHFDYCDQATWAALSKDIKGWLATEVDTETQLWTWGHDAFWLAFIVAHPLFPRGSWPMWDSHIPLEGTFIEQWLEQSGNTTVMAGEQDIRGDIWAEFCRHAALFFPHPLVTSD